MLSRARAISGHYPPEDYRGHRCPTISTIIADFSSKTSIVAGLILATSITCLPPDLLGSVETILNHRSSPSRHSGRLFICSIFALTSGFCSSSKVSTLHIFTCISSSPPHTSPQRDISPSNPFTRPARMSAWGRSVNDIPSLARIGSMRSMVRPSRALGFTTAFLRDTICLLVKGPLVKTAILIHQNSMSLHTISQ